MGNEIAGPDDPARQRRLDWSTLLKRAWAIDVFVCPKCSGPMRVVGVIEDERTALKILAHLGLRTRAPPHGPPRRLPVRDQRLAAEGPAADFDGIDPPLVD